MGSSTRDYSSTRGSPKRNSRCSVSFRVCTMSLFHRHHSLAVFTRPLTFDHLVLPTRHRRHLTELYQSPTIASYYSVNFTTVSALTIAETIIYTTTPPAICERFSILPYSLRRFFELVQFPCLLDWSWTDITSTRDCERLYAQIPSLQPGL